ncbi:apolipoprotein N-acyltransferase [Nocardioides daphniae]
MATGRVPLDSVGLDGDRHSARGVGALGRRGRHELHRRLVRQPRGRGGAWHSPSRPCCSRRPSPTCSHAYLGGRCPSIGLRRAHRAGCGRPSLLPAPSTGPDWQQGEESVRAAAVQGDVPGAGNDVVAVHRQVTANHVEATTNLAQQIRERQAQQPDFVLWPENSTAVDPFRDERTRLGIDRASSAIGVPVVVGAIVDGDRPDEVLNQGLVWNEQGVVTERYTKRHPVPFGEYIPFRKQLAGLQIGRLDMIPRDMTPGSRTKPLDIAGTKVADLICFDVAFDDSVTAQVRRGAELVTVQTSNASFTGTAQLEQQFAITRFRALETGRTVVVASTNGISGAIGPDGEVLARLEPRTTAVLEVTVPLLDRQTNAVRFGALVKNLIGLIGIGAMVAAGLRLRRGEST